MYKDVEKQREANREKARRHRERVKGVTEGVTEVVEKVTPEPKGVTRINPRTGRGYGPEMLAMSDAVLSSYEHHWGAEPIYGEGGGVSVWREVLEMWEENPDKVRAMVSGVCEKSELGDLIRWGAYGPTYSEVQRILKL